MSEYSSLTANIDGLMSAVKLTWETSLAGAETMFSQSIYYTDVYLSGDGGLIHDNKVLDLALDASSATITGLTSDRRYDFTIVGKTSEDGDFFEKDVSANPHQLAGVPEFTLEKGSNQFTVKVSNHKESTKKYILFINGNTTDKIRTITVSDNEVTNGTWTKLINTDITNSTMGVKSFYEVSLRAVNSISTSAMTGSQTVEATDALPDVTGLEVLTGPERPANINSKAIVSFNAVPGANGYLIKAFTATSLNTLASMIDDSTTDSSSWFDVSNTFFHMNKLTANNASLLVEGTKYRFAVVPYGLTTSADSLAFKEATPSTIPNNTDIDLTMYTGIDISNGTDPMAFAEMDGKLRLDWNMSQDEYLALGNGLPLTGMIFDLSGTDNDVTKQITVAGDLSNGSVTFSGLTNSKKYKAAVRTTNANGISETTPVFEATESDPVSTRPTNFTLIAGPAVGARDKNKDGSLDISYNMNGNGLTVDHDVLSTDFRFDISGMDDAVGGENGNGIDICFNAVNLLMTSGPTVVGNRYIIKARASNANGDASPKELTAIVKPSKPPAVKGNGSFSDSRIYIKETTDINKIVADFSNMATDSNGYGVTGARVRAVYDGANEAWSGDWMIVNDLSKDVEINLPAIVNDNDPHTNYVLDVEPFNAVYDKDYQVVDTELTIDGGDYGKVMKSGLDKHTTVPFSVISSRLGITNLRMTTEPYDMSNNMKFEWRCDATSDSNNLELLVAEAGLNDANTGYKVPTWSDYKLLGSMSSVKYEADAEDPATTEMSFDLSNDAITNTIKFAAAGNADDKEMKHARAYYFMVREEAHPGNEERAFGVSKSVPVVTDLSFSDYKSRDLITFTIDPNGAKLSSLFLLNNVNPTGDYFFNVLESGAVPSSTYEKLNTKISGEIKVAIQKEQFERNKEDFPQNVLFHTLAGNSAGVTLGTSAAVYADLNGSSVKHPIDVAAEALEWAVKAEALADEADALAATINGQAPENNNGIPNDNNLSPADVAAALVRVHAGLARGASNDAARDAVGGRMYDATTIPNNGANKTALEQHTLAKSDLDALRLLSA